MLINIFMVAIGGALGALCRYGLCGLINYLYKPQLTLGTIVVNLIGCFIMGLLVSLFHGRVPVSDQMKLLVLTGFLGAFTTFSTYTLESVSYMIEGKFYLAIWNIAVSTIISLPLLYWGMRIGKQL